MCEVKSRMKGKHTTVELLPGQTLLPGFIEPHVHIVSSAMIMEGWKDFGPFDGQNLLPLYNSEWLKEQIKNAKAKLELPSFWVLGHSVDPSLMPFTSNKCDLNELESLDCDAVDKMETDVPVLMLSASGHTAYVNTKTLRVLYEKTKPSGFDSFEEYREHVNSHGGLQELVEIIPAFEAIPRPQLLKTIFGVMKGLDVIVKLASKRGVTLLYDAAMSPILKAILDIWYLSSSSSTIRIGYALLCNTLEEAKNLDSNITPMNEEFHNLYQGNVKLISDGSNQGLTGYQHENYRCKPDENTGIFNYDVDEFNQMVKVITSKHWPIMVHANGNKAIEKVLIAYEKALDGESGLIKRHRIEHCSILDEDAIKRMFELGLSPSFLIGHVGYWGYVFHKGIFEDKAQLLDPCKSALDNGLRITLQTDYFVSPLGPLRMMEQAITRIMEQDPNRAVLNEDERITPAQALRAITYDAAWQCQADKWVGSLEEGKLADYVILAEDPITRKDPVGMRNIPVLETWVDGFKM